MKNLPVKWFNPKYSRVIVCFYQQSISEMLGCSFSAHDGYHVNFRKVKFWTTQGNIISGGLSTNYFSYLYQIQNTQLNQKNLRSHLTPKQYRQERTPKSEIHQTWREVEVHHAWGTKEPHRKELPLEKEVSRHNELNPVVKHLLTMRRSHWEYNPFPVTQIRPNRAP